MKLATILTAMTLTLSFCACAQKQNNNMEKSANKETEIKKTDAELKKQLTPEQYNVCIGKGTEPAFTGKYWNHHGKGIYKCAVCNEPLFDSKTKYDSGSGWPSFFSPMEKSKVKEDVDKSYGMIRTEITCKKCGSHLGHVFDDGPNPTGLRYCVNSASLEFEEKKEEK